MFLKIAQAILLEVGDWGVSVFIVLWWCNRYGVKPDWKYFGVGAVFVIFPDLIPNEWLIRQLSVGADVFGGESHHHREFGHYPIVLAEFALLMWAICKWWQWDTDWVVLFAVCVTWHLLHDAIGIGWGIKPLAPFCDYSLKFCVDDANGNSLQHLVVWWSPEDLAKAQALAAERAVPGEPDWFHRIYLSWHWNSALEYAAFIVGMIKLLIVKRS